jgi:capsid protein
MSWLGAAVSRIQDIREALDNELASAKLNTKIGLVVESEEAGSLGLGANLRKVENTDGSKQNLEKVYEGVGTVQLKPGEKISAHTFDRPNLNLTQFVDYLTREIAYSVGVSPEVIWSMSGLNGTATRSALQDADTFFAGVRLIIEQQFCARFWRYAIWQFIKSGKLPYPGNDWFRVSFVNPPKVSIDFGRDSKSMLDLVRAGLLSRRKYHNSLGEDSETQMDDVIREAARRKKRIAEIAAEEGVELSEREIFPPAPGAADPGKDSSQSQDEDEEEDEEDAETEDDE